jgi:hypothetical protein
MANPVNLVEPPVTAPISAGPMNAGALIAPFALKNDADRYNEAIENADTKAIKKLATSPNVEVKTAAEAAKKVIDKTEPLVNHLLQIDPNTAEGRLSLANTYQTLNKREEAQAKGWTTIQDSPQIGTALLRYALGDKLGAMRQITGGDVKSETEYDDNGNMLIVNRNELGQIDSIFDKEGKMLSRQEYADRGGSRPLENTLARERQKQFQKDYIGKYITDTENQNKAYGSLSAAAGYSREMSDLADGFKNFDDKTLGMLNSFNNSTLNYATSVSNVIQDLNSASSSKGKNLNSANIKEIENKTGSVLGTVFHHVEGDTFKNDAGETASASSLAQKMQSATSGKNIERNVTQAKDDLAKQIALAQKQGAPEEKIQQYQKLMRYFDLAGMREKIYLEHKEKMPSFAQLPTQLPNITDQAARMKLNALQGEYAAAQMGAFLDWKDQELKKERAINPNFVPEPGRYEAQWVKQKQFVEMEDAFRARAKDVLNKTPVLEKPVNTAQLPVGPVPAPQANENVSKEGAVPPAIDRSKQFKVIPNETAPANSSEFKVRRKQK